MSDRGAALPDPRLLAPELLIPGRKPVGPVKLRGNLPKFPEFAFLSGEYYDHAKRRALPIGIENGHQNTKRALVTEANDYVSFDINEDWSSTTGYTAICRFKALSEPAAWDVPFAKMDAAAGAQWQIGTATVNLYVANSNANIAYFSEFSRTDWDSYGWITLAIGWDGTTCFLAGETENGPKGVFASQTLGAMDTGSHDVIFGAETSTPDNIDSDFETEMLVFIKDWCAPPALLRQLAKDPYRIFEPA